MKIIWFVFYLVLSFFQIKAQSSFDLQPPQGQYRINHLNSADGLSNNRVRVITQDAEGFLWFGTQNGLNKYDGFTIKTYWPDQDDSTSVTSAMITDLMVDSRGELWVAGFDGIDIYNHDYENFRQFTDSLKPKPNHIYAVTEDKYETVWIGTNIGLFSYSLQHQKIKYYGSLTENNDQLLQKGVNRLFIDDQNRLWIAIFNYGIAVYNIETDNFKLYRHNPNDAKSISGIRVLVMNQDKKGNVWIGTMDNGLNRYDPENDNFIRYNVDPDVSFTSRITAIFEDLSGNFFVGTRAGLYMYNPQKETFFLYASMHHNFSKLSQNSIISQHIDNTGTLWIGTFSGGANYIDLHRKAVVHYTAEKSSNQFLSDPNVFPITEDENGNIWVGTDNGLNVLDRTTHRFHYFKNDPDNSNSLIYNDVKALAWGKSNELWIGTNPGGLNCLDVKENNFTLYKHDPNNPKSIYGDRVFSILFDKFDNMWVTTNRVSDRKQLGIDILPKGKTEFIHLKEKPDIGIDEDEAGNVYFGATNGFWMFNRKDSTFNLHSNDACIEFVNVVKKDSENGVWIGSSKGLVRYGINDSSYTWFAKSTGFPISEVFGIIEDDNKSLWVTTASGLFQFEGVIADTSDKTFVRYDQQDGFQSDQFNYNSFYKCESGEIVVGGVNGFNTFFPDKIKKDTTLAKVLLTDFKIANKSVSIGEEIFGRVVLDQSITVTNELVLNYKHRIFTIVFSTLQRNNHNEPLFRTKMVGLDNDWHYRSSGNNLVTYTNLSPGKYTFMVSAANTDGVWNPSPRTLEIIVTTPVWREWWFWGVLVLLLFGISLLVYQIRIRSVNKLNAMLEDKVKSRTAEVVEKNKLLESANQQLKDSHEEIITQKEELEKHRNNLAELIEERTADLVDALKKARESDELKSAFLANMSHEIRTPMNAIVGFSGILESEEYSKQERLEFIAQVQNNADMLLKIINEIIDLSIIESNQLEIINNIFGLNVILDNLYSFYCLDNKNKDIELRINNELEAFNYQLYSDETRVRQIITNLMNNALKFTRKGFVELGVFKSKDKLHIYVKDSGKGIPANAIDTIFNRFAKIDENETGLGLGLAISKNIAQSLGGDLTVNSEEGKGSMFVLSIPFNWTIAQEGLIKEKTRSSSKVNWSGKTILIAEDVEANYLYLKSALKNTGANLIWAQNGLETIQKYENTEKVDVILMDIKMPKLDGYNTAKLIKEKDINQVIVAQTAYARPHEKMKFNDENFDEYIAKPIKQAELFNVLGKFFQSPKA